MDYETRLLDERLIGEEKGRQEGIRAGRTVLQVHLSRSDLGFCRLLRDRRLRVCPDSGQAAGGLLSVVLHDRHLAGQGRRVRSLHQR